MANDPGNYSRDNGEGFISSNGHIRVGPFSSLRSQAGAILAVLLSLSPALPASAQAVPELVNGLTSGIDTCIQSFGESAAMQTAFTSAGWKIASNRPFIRYAAAKRSLLAGHSRPEADETFCMVSAKNLTMEQAEGITRATLKKLNGFRPHPAQDRTWVGRLNGKDVWLSYSISMPTPSFDAPVIAFVSPLE